MAKIEWKDEYNIGIGSIDQDHQGLVDLINRLSEEGSNIKHVKWILSQ